MHEINEDALRSLAESDRDSAWIYRAYLVAYENGEVDLSVRDDRN